MIKSIKFPANNPINLCGSNKPCKFIILIGNNSTGKTFTIENLYRDFDWMKSPNHYSDNFNYIFLINGCDYSRYGWEKGPNLSWQPKCLYIPSLAKTIFSQNIKTELNNCKELAKIIEELLNQDKVDNDKHKDEESYERDKNKRFISAFLNDFFGTDKYEIEKNNASGFITLIKNKELSINNASSGEIRALSIVVYILTNHIYDENDRLILIDEPETFMHPKAQINLANWFNSSLAVNSTSNGQYFIATHSPFIVKSFLEKFKDDTKIIYYSKNINDKGKMTYSIKTIDKPIYLNSDNISISEINFHVFQIPSNDYFLELYEHLMKKYMNKNNITEISFFDFDKEYLRTKDSELIQYDKPSSDNDGKQTSLSRFRHLIAHGGNIGTEKGYINYRNNVFNPLSTTKDFYNKYENKYMKLLEDQINKLIKYINKFQ